MLDMTPRMLDDYYDELVPIHALEDLRMLDVVLAGSRLDSAGVDDTRERLLDAWRGVAKPGDITTKEPPPKRTEAEERADFASFKAELTGFLSRHEGT